MDDAKLEARLDSASPAEVVVMLYEGAIGFVDKARQASLEGRQGDRAHWIGRALNIVSALQEGLDLEVGGDVARNLDSLYFFVEERLIEGNARGDVSPMDEATRVLRSLLPAWTKAAEAAAEPAVPATAPA